MRKYIALILALVLLLTLAGCNSKVTILEEDGEKFLQLPVSQKRVYVWKQMWEYLDKVDYALLEAADNALLEEIAPYADDKPGYSLVVYEGELCICVEIIVDINPPATTPDNTEGCGIDHEHLFFRKPITKGLNAEE